MLISKDRVALESCPAKTAESVSYIATFTVLGCLLLGNFSNLQSTTTHGNILAEAEIRATSQSNSIAARALMGPAENAEYQSTALPYPKLADSAVAAHDAADEQLPYYSPLADLAEWHSNLGQIREDSNLRGHRQFSVSDWNSQAQNLTLFATPQTADLSMPLPLLDPEVAAQLGEGPTLASLNGDPPRSIREITVTGSEPERLMARPDNIRRPQLPRPYRAQDIQRTLVLPPRIQALRP